VQVIPVLDLMAGQVVHAVRGERAAYRPIMSALCPGHAPVPLADALCRAAGSTLLYVADLDALAGRPVQVDVVRALLGADARRTLWLDAGFRTVDGVRAVCKALGDTAARLVPVVGSESLRGADDLKALQPWWRMPGTAVLSLDRRAGRPMDAADAWRQPRAWPDRVIVMTLERVGADAGPDLDTLRAVRQAAAPGTVLIGAGGVRDAADLAAAAAAGAQAWLVASALHHGRLGGAAHIG
jgi:HisA/HisF family protein